MLLYLINAKFFYNLKKILMQNTITIDLLLNCLNYILIVFNTNNITKTIRLQNIDNLQNF